MPQTNSAYVTKLSEWKHGSHVEDAIRSLERNPNGISRFEYLTIAGVKGRGLNSEGIFTIEYGLDGNGMAYTNTNPTLTTPLEVPPGSKTFRAQHSARYRHSNGEFDLLVPERGLLYVIQKLLHDTWFVQWASNNYDDKQRKIIDGADIAVFQDAGSHTPPLAALVNGSDVLVMGRSLIGSKGYYREIGEN